MSESEALTLQQLVAAFEQKGPTSLGVLRRQPALVYCSSESIPESIGFETRAGAAPWDHRIAVALASSGTNAPPELMARAGSVYAVAKRPGGPFPDRIGVGRARTADICLRHGSVSKYHAYFAVGAGDEWTVWDARSRNGTRVGDRWVTAGEGLALDSVTQLMFGDETFVWFRPEPLRRLLESLATRS